MKVYNYMAIIRNLNNLAKVKVSEKHWKKIINALQYEPAVKGSKQFPFRFYSALKHINIKDDFKHKEVQKALEQALQYSVINLPKLKGRTYIATDLSGSMHSPLSQKSSMQYVEIGALMSAMSNRFSDNAIICAFGESFKVISSMTGNILEDTKNIIKTDVGHSTNGWLAIKHLVENNIEVDRVLVFTDEQLWDSTSWGGNETISKYWGKYEQMYPNAKIYIVNLNGYGESCIDYTKPNVVQVFGWSEKIIKFISVYELGPKSFIDQIKGYS